MFASSKTFRKGFSSLNVTNYGLTKLQQQGLKSWETEPPVGSSGLRLSECPSRPKLLKLRPYSLLSLLSYSFRKV